MPDVWTREELDFMTRLDELGREGLSQSEAAARLGIAPGTINYRVNRTRRLKVGALSFNAIAPRVCTTTFASR